MSTDNGSQDESKEVINEVARVVDAALAHAAGLAANYGVPPTDIWPIAEYILERSAQMSAAEQSWEQLHEVAVRASGDPVLARFVAGEPLG
jgi:hypothetical protein